jgi:hypothetical protein
MQGEPDGEAEACTGGSATAHSAKAASDISRKRLACYQKPYQIVENRSISCKRLAERVSADPVSSDI